MNLTSEHLLESMLILALFYLVYMLFLNSQANFRINRYFLLSGLVSSLFLPFVDFSAPNMGQLNFYIQLKTVDVFASGSDHELVSSGLSYTKLIGYAYLVGVLFFSIRFLYQFLIITRLFLGSVIVKQNQGLIVYTTKEHPVFSFLSFIFIGMKSINKSDLEIILNHEKVHVAQKHSIDLLLLELLAIVQWFNPIVWLYRKMVKQNHEYLADKGVVSTGVPNEKYQELLLGNYRGLFLGLTNSFNHSLTFKRLIMMKKSGTNKFSVLRLALTAPLIVLAVYFISCSKSEHFLLDQSGIIKIEKPGPDVKQIGEPSKEKEFDAQKSLTGKQEPTAADEEMIYESYAIDEKPRFPGGDFALIQYVAENTAYPEEARINGIEGIVYIRFTVTKTGGIGNTSVMREVDPLLEAEAIRVVQSLPKWEPGKNKGEPVDVWFIIPVKFKLQ
jgi:TonB family protein